MNPVCSPKSRNLELFWGGLPEIETQVEKSKKHDYFHMNCKGNIIGYTVGE